MFYTIIFVGRYNYGKIYNFRPNRNYKYHIIQYTYWYVLKLTVKC